MKTFKFFLESREATSVGIFPGAFKPPHKGHFDTVKKAAAENNKVFVLISAIDRDNITSQDSLAIWNIYKPYLPKNVHYILVSGSPVLVVYHIVDILNNGQFTPTLRSPAAHPQAQEIISLINSKGPFTINLYASSEDTRDRYGSFFKQNNINTFRGKQVRDINQKEVSRLASATKAREALVKKSYEQFKTLLPPITKEDMHRVYKALVK